MSISIIPLSEADPAGVLELLAAFWQRDWTETALEDYFAWRYGRRGNGETLVACDGNRCVATLDSFLRRYSIGGRQQLVRETCDWFCLPQYQTLGVGLHLMRRMMATPEPILLLGGSEATLDLLPRLKWARLPNAERFLLVVSARNAVGRVGPRLGRYGVALARLIPDARVVRRLRRAPPPTAAAHVQRRESGAGKEELSSMAAYDFAPWLDASILDWLSSAPAVLGEFVVLDFFNDQKLVGVSVSRLQRSAFGCEAHIVHVQAERLALIDWIVSETTHQLVDRGAGAVACETSCPVTGRVLTALRFIRRRPVAAHWWHANQQSPAGLLNLTSLRADDALGCT
jgi:hypothetical protein